MWIFNCLGADAQKPHVVQGSLVLNKYLNEQLNKNV